MNFQGRSCRVDGRRPFLRPEKSHRRKAIGISFPGTSRAFVFTSNNAHLDLFLRFC